MFLVRIDKVPPGESARNVSAVYFDRAGVVSVGVFRLSSQDTEAQRGVGRGRGELVVVTGGQHGEKAVKAGVGCG